MLKKFYNPFEISPEVQELLVQIDDTNRAQIKNKITELITEQHGHSQIQFLSANNTLLQISVADWAEHLTKKSGESEPWYVPDGASVAYEPDARYFKQRNDGTYDHVEYELKELGPRDSDIGREPGIEGVTGKQVNVASLDLYINGEKYDQPPLEIEIDQQRLRDRVRQGVIDDLRQQWGSDTTQALDNQGRVVTLTVEQVADMAMQSHYEQGMKDLNQPFSKRPAEQDIRTIYGKAASDMYGKVTVNGVEKSVDRHGNVVIDEIMPAGSLINVEYASGLGREWRPENVLRRNSKTVYKPVRKVSLREKARAQRRARRKSR